MSTEKYGRLPARWLHGSGRKGRKKEQTKIEKIILKKNSVSSSVL